MRRLLLTALVASAVLAAPAVAATVDVRYDTEWNEWRVVYDAAPGERNDVRLRSLDDFTIRVHDPAVRLGAGYSCRAIDEHTADCGVPPDTPPRALSSSPSMLIKAVVRVGDMDDVARVEGAGGPVLFGHAGPGDDTLIGSDVGSDGLDGGGGRDRLIGRGDADGIVDGDGRDGAPVDADVLDGGPGLADTVDYSARSGDLTIDLADPGSDGERGEGDVLAGIENVLGGAGDDDVGGADGSSWLIGGAGDDHLDGEGGDDWLEGRSGDDRLHGHDAQDRLDGGPGSDRLRGDAGDDELGGSAGKDRAACGDGFDRVEGGGGGFLVGDCEDLTFQFDELGRPAVDSTTTVSVEPHPVLASDGRALLVTIGCTQFSDGAGMCGRTAGTVRVATRSGVPLGSGRFSEEFPDRRNAPKEVIVPVRLGPKGRRLAARGGVLRVSVREDQSTASWLTRPGRAGR